MKLQAASKKEVSRIAVGTLVCDGIMIPVLFLLSQFDIGTFSLLPVLLGAVLGTAVAVMNFVILCLTVQSAVEIEDKRKMKARFQLSYNIRLGLLAAWVVLCFAIPQIHFFAGALPILFPKAVIFYLQYKGRLVPPGEHTASSAAPDDEEPEDRLESFEV